MQKPISTDRKNFLDIVRDRKSQTAAVAIVATAMALTFSVMSFQDPNAPQEQRPKDASFVGRIKNATFDTFDIKRSIDSSSDDSKSEKKESEKSTFSTALASSTQSQTNLNVQNVSTTQRPTVESNVPQSSSQSNSNSNEKEKNEDQKVTQSDTATSLDAAKSSDSKNSKEEPKSAQSRSSEQSNSSEKSKTSENRISADEMNRSVKVNNWDGEKEVAESKLDKEWNSEDEVEELKTR